MGEANIPSDLKDLVDKLNSTVQQIIDNLKNIPNLPPNIAAALQVLQDGVGTILKSLADTLKNTIDKLGGPSSPGAKDAISCLLIGLKPLLVALLKIVDEVLKAVIAALPGASTLPGIPVLGLPDIGSITTIAGDIIKCLQALPVPVPLPA